MFKPYSIIGIILTCIALMILFRWRYSVRKPRERFVNGGPSKCYTCERETRDIGYPAKCIDCERGRSSGLEYVLGFPAPMAKASVGM
jgi:hypothetical protein